MSMLHPTETRRKMTKPDLKRAYQELYNPSAKTISVVTVPPLNFLMLDGAGDPNTAQAYSDAVQALYTLAYTLKFHLKKNGGAEYVVMPLEGLWWADDMTQFTTLKKEDWRWTMMLLQPDFITPALVQEAKHIAHKKKPLAALAEVRFETFEEGLAAQILYVGAYADEGPTIQRLHAHIHESGHELRGKHHEIYLGDPRKTAPAKLKTVIRQPMA